MRGAAMPLAMLLAAAIGLQAGEAEIEAKRKAALEQLLRVLPKSEPFERWLEATGELPPDFDALPRIPGLPDPLSGVTGTNVRTPEAWAGRGANLLRLFERYVIGTMPPPPGNVEATVLAERRESKVWIQEIRLAFGPGRRATLRLELLIPDGEGPFPVFLTQHNHLAWAPCAQERLAREHHPADPLRLRIELWRPKETANETRGLVLADREAHDAVSVVTQSASVEPEVPCRERRTSELVQERDDLRPVLHSLSSDLVTDLVRPEPPTPEELSLLLAYVLVEDDQRLAAPVTSSSAWLNSDSRARRTASAMASLQIAPRQFSMIASHTIPRATCSSTSLTRILVPRKVGWPWQISGSTTTRRPKVFSFSSSIFEDFPWTAILDAQGSRNVSFAKRLAEVQARPRVKEGGSSRFRQSIAAQCSPGRLIALRV